ncbi:signal transduction histidine kinase [Stella humosa]|uniref:histidine kinase n=1 Tax=Stella humosa TaxID=94 RepID=A0A3N1L111_9PROT|nr:PAS domain-containing sensor histidine kinase [Stella humosa]ROP84670.1 signal transduction histidine kinase [Stella humosa]BBK34190.1 hypothetical protein STHU_48240 [Stella humosa]
MVGPDGTAGDATTVRIDALSAELDRRAMGVAIFAPGARLVFANASLRRFLAGRDPEVAALPDADGRLVLPGGRSVAARRLPLDGGGEAILVPSPGADTEFLRHILDSLDTTVVAYDRDDRYLFGNVAYHRRYPHLPPEAELVGTTFEGMLRRTIAAGSFADAQAEHDPEAYIARRVAEFRANQPAMTEWMTVSGNWEKVRVIRTPSGLRLSLRTRITEVKRVQEELRRAKERLETETAVRDRFVRRLSHEFRTPLSAVLGYSEMVEGEVLGSLETPKYREYAALIRHSGEHLLDLVSGLADAVEEVAPTLRDEDIDVGRMLAREVTVVAPMAQAAGIQLAANLDDDLPQLRADARMVRQMLLNLLSNGVRFSTKGAVTASARLRPDGGISLVVADQGAGMAPAVLARLGEPFYRGEADAAGRPAGTGLGLGVVKDLIALHQGRLVLASTLGQGTTAELEFPPERTVAAGG